MRDFTLDTYRKFISALTERGYRFCTLEDVCSKNPAEPYIVLRHDVDRMPDNALRMAELENELGLKATYFFRIVSNVFDVQVIKKIASMGHRIGYHFEDLSSAHGDIGRAVDSFKKNLEKLREVVPVETVAMHGKPLSKYDNKKLIKAIDFDELNILCEPYSIVEEKGLLYLTDTGRKWNSSSNLRDKVLGHVTFNVQGTLMVPELLKKKFPERNVMINCHPERWDNRPVPWLWNAVWQSFKNSVKYLLVKNDHGK